MALTPSSEPNSEQSLYRDSARSNSLSKAAQASQATFGYSSLRPHQEAVLEHVLANRDCLAVLPTGAGKSLCYALPAQMRPGLVLVLSPLIALIRDQQRKFAASGIPCAALDSLQTTEERAAVWDRLDRGELRLLIVSPERLARPDFRARLQREKLQLVAIDEAHCISHWGSHFRPDYGPVPKLAVTATATARVREDIVQALRLRNPELVWADFARDNLQLKVVKADKAAPALASTLQAVLQTSGSGIVYAPTRKQTREVGRMLDAAGIKTALYHAGLTPPAREAAQRAFMAGSVRVVVATHAFGLGIDKADIRFVHHAGLPGSLEQYVQEIGRAGRDGKPASCSLVFGSRDYHIHKFMIDKSFPEVAVLRLVLDEAREFIGGSIGQSPAALNRYLVESSKLSTDDIETALNVLCREGLLSRLRARGGVSGFDEELIADGYCDDEAGMFRDYPLRKMDSMAKLDAMRTFATLGDGRMQFLDRYFRG